MEFTPEGFECQHPLESCGVSCELLEWEIAHNAGFFAFWKRHVITTICGVLLASGLIIWVRGGWKIDALIESWIVALLGVLILPRLHWRSAEREYLESLNHPAYAETMTLVRKLDSGLYHNL